MSRTRSSTDYHSLRDSIIQVILHQEEEARRTYPGVGYPFHEEFALVLRDILDLRDVDDLR